MAIYSGQFLHYNGTIMTIERVAFCVMEWSSPGSGHSCNGRDIIYDQELCGRLHPSPVVGEFVSIPFRYDLALPETITQHSWCYTFYCRGNQ